MPTTWTSSRSTEAFAVVTMAAMRDLDLPHEKVNVHGGGLRARPSGRRLRRTHRHHAPGGGAEKYGLDKGAAALCIGGGEATALAVERLH